jgi:hypothetical protein
MDTMKGAEVRIELCAWLDRPPKLSKCPFQMQVRLMYYEGHMHNQAMFFSVLMSCMRRTNFHE